MQDVAVIEYTQKVFRVDSIVIRIKEKVVKLAKFLHTLDHQNQTIHINQNF